MTVLNTYLVKIGNTEIRWNAKSAKSAVQSVLRSKACPDICPMVDEVFQITLE